MEIFEYKGVWWLPENPERKVSGILKFDPKMGGILETIGGFIDINIGDQPSYPEIILGKSSKGKFSLLENRFVNSDLTMENIGTSVYQTLLICEGIHLEDASDLEFSSFSIHYSYLNQWLGISTFKTERNFESGKNNVTFQRRKPVKEVLLNENTTFSLEVVSYNAETWAESTQIHQKAYATIKVSSKLPMSRIEQLIHNFQYFLSLAINSPVHELEIIGVMVGNYFDAHSSTYKEGFVQVKLHRPYLDTIITPEFSIFPRKSPLFFCDILLGYPQILDKFDTLLKTWFEKANYLGTVYELYFAVLYNSKLYPKNKFLNLAQALEVYHRKKTEFVQIQIPDEEYFQQIESILSCLTEEQRKWLEPKLKHSNQKSLMERISYILSVHLSNILQQISVTKQGFKALSEKKHQESLIWKIVNNRNYLTHYDSRLQNQAADDLELYYITEKIKIIVCLCLMKEIGFEENEIVKFITHGNVGSIMDLTLTASLNKRQQ